MMILCLRFWTVFWLHLSRVLVPEETAVDVADGVGADAAAAYEGEGEKMGASADKGVTEDGTEWGEGEEEEEEEDGEKEKRIISERIMKRR